MTVPAAIKELEKIEMTRQTQIWGANNM